MPHLAWHPCICDQGVQACLKLPLDWTQVSGEVCADRRSKRPFSIISSWVIKDWHLLGLSIIRSCINHQFPGLPMVDQLISWFFVLYYPAQDTRTCSVWIALYLPWQEHHSLTLSCWSQGCVSDFIGPRLHHGPHRNDHLSPLTCTSTDLAIRITVVISFPFHGGSVSQL